MGEIAPSAGLGRVLQLTPIPAIQPLLQNSYPLTQVSLEKLDFLTGVWGAPCEELDVFELPREFCEFLEFTVSASGKMRLFRGASADLDGYAPDGWDQWEAFSYAQRHFERKENDVVLLDLIIVFSDNGFSPVPVKLSITENGMTMTFFEGDNITGVLYRAR